MVLLFALFTISGGIYLSGDVRATPRHNLTLLAAGAVLANVIGTMGASMVLIHPLLRINTERARVKHTIVFFIFLVGNIGGLLTPLGPPLFLGYLRGVPFAWTLGLWPEWLLVVGLTLAAYFVLDTYHYRQGAGRLRARGRRELRAHTPEGRPEHRAPGRSSWSPSFFSGPLARAGDAIHFPFVRDAILVILAMISLTLGPRRPARGQPLPLVARSSKWRCCSRASSRR